jgi:isoleucyl-tRNA synthetase
VNRIQKLRKKAALEPTDIVEVYFKSLDEDKSLSERVLNSQVILSLFIQESFCT